MLKRPTIGITIDQALKDKGPLAQAYEADPKIKELIDAALRLEGLIRGAGVHAIDTMVITHGDIEHAGGAVALMREMRPFEIWEGVPVPRLPLRQNLQAAAQLRWRLGTLQSRLARGRVKLKARLARRGVALSTALLGAGLAGAPEAWAEATVRAAIRFTTKSGAAALGEGPASAALARGIT